MICFPLAGIVLPYRLTHPPPLPSLITTPPGRRGSGLPTGASGPGPALLTPETAFPVQRHTVQWPRLCCSFRPRKAEESTEQIPAKSDRSPPWLMSRPSVTTSHPDPSTHPSAETTLAPFVTTINDFSPYDPSPGSHQGARSLSTSDLWPWARRHPLNTYLLSWLRTPVRVLWGFGARGQTDPFSLLT